MLSELMHKARTQDQYQALIDTFPYATTIGLSCLKLGDELIFKLDGKQSNIGNPLMPAIHGGVIGGVMELAATFHIALTSDINQLPKIVDFSIDYLRSAHVVDTFAKCEVIRQGRRVVNVNIKTWQASPDQAITTARAHFLLPGH
jgi:acyl-coenzyme A thioesterase PaaI-like protein